MKDFASVRAAIGGLKGVMSKLNDAPEFEHKWKVMPKCPFCLHKGSAGVFTKGGVDYFKCHYTSCCSGGAVLTEVSYIAMREGLSETAPAEGGPSPAYRRFLELAGCYEAPSGAATGGKAEKLKSGKLKSENEPAPPASPAPPAQEQSPAPLPAAPPAAGLPNPVLPTEAAAQLDLNGAVAAGPDKPLDDEAMLLQCIEIIRIENKASVSLLQRRLKLGYSRAGRIMDELERRGIVGPSLGAAPREILKLPEKPAHLIAIKLGEEIHIEDTRASVPVTPVAAAAAPIGANAAGGAGKNGESKLPPGMAALRAFYAELPPTEEQMAPVFEGRVHWCDKCGAVAAGLACKKCGGVSRELTQVPDPLPAVLVRKLQFKPVSLFAKRALTSVSCAALGLRANPAAANEARLQALGEQFAWEELRASGLWLEANRKAKLGRRPNAQFHGKGQIGRKPERERRSKDDKWVWGFCEPVLIPFFDEAGDLLKLRPHKGGAPAGTLAGRPRIYVPRDYRHCADQVEKFYEVIICEGEYKAMAIWQTLGLGALIQEYGNSQQPITDSEHSTFNIQPSTFNHQPPMGNGRFEPVGVCALPGISYVTNPEMRMDLERWLKDVEARRVIVAFDDEDKSDKPLRQRFDAQRDARVLAIELSKTLHVDARVCVLPKEWRNRRGKADWDGALVKLTAEAGKKLEPTDVGGDK